MGPLKLWGAEEPVGAKPQGEDGADPNQVEPPSLPELCPQERPSQSPHTLLASSPGTGPIALHHSKISTNSDPSSKLGRALGPLQARVQEHPQTFPGCRLQRAAYVLSTWEGTLSTGAGSTARHETDAFSLRGASPPQVRDTPCRQQRLSGPRNLSS